MLLYAQRGSSRTRPENSIAAFEQALADGADGVELDLRATTDGVPVILHDRALDRTTNGRGNVDEMSLADLRILDAGDGRPPPTLAEVLDLLAGRLPLDLDIKQPGIERQILAVLARYPAAQWAASSFDWDVLRLTRSASPLADLWPLAWAADDALFAIARRLGSERVALPAAAVTPEVISRCQHEGVGVMAWRVDEVAEAVRLRDLGVEIVCTNAPAALRQGLAASTA